MRLKLFETRHSEVQTELVLQKIIHYVFHWTLAFGPFAVLGAN